MTAQNRRKPQVTFEMKAAGADALDEWRDVAAGWFLAEQVYIAMENARIPRSRRLSHEGNSTKTDEV